MVRKKGGGKKEADVSSQADEPKADTKEPKKSGKKDGKEKRTGKGGKQDEKDGATSGPSHGGADDAAATKKEKAGKKEGGKKKHDKHKEDKDGDSTDDSSEQGGAVKKEPKRVSVKVRQELTVDAKKSSNDADGTKQQSKAGKVKVAVTEFVVTNLPGDYKTAIKHFGNKKFSEQTM